MSAEKDALTESEVPLFDVIVRLPSGANFDAIRERAITEAGIQEDKIDALLRALKNSPKAKIGSGVPKERADKAQADFSKAGLHVDVSPVLSVQTMTTGAFDGLFTCPACRNKVVLPDNRQCPSCNVFVDKVTDEFLLKRKILEQERAMAEARMARESKDSSKRSVELNEKEMRDKIRREIEKEYGLTSEDGSVISSKWVKALLVLLLIGGAVAAGRFSNDVPGLGGKLSESPPAGAKGSTSAAAGAGGSSAGAGGAADGGGAGGAADGGGPGNSADAVIAGDDPESEDSLLKASRNGGPNAKGITMEQAIAASTALAKSVGNTTAERALKGESIGPAGAKGAALGGGGGSAAAGGGAAAGGAEGGGGSAVAGGGGAGGSGARVASVPAQTKLELSGEFAVRLAELGQLPRAREAVKALRARPDAKEMRSVAIIQMAEIEVLAWSAREVAPNRARALVDVIKEGIGKLLDPYDRAIAQARAGAILAAQPAIARDVIINFLSEGGEAIKLIANADQQRQAVGELAVSMGQALLSDMTELARKGQWAKAKAAYTRFAATAAQTPNVVAAAKLQGLDFRARYVMGQGDESAAALDAGLAWVTKGGSLLEQARALRGLAASSDNAANPKIQETYTRLQAQAQNAQGADRARALAELALMQADSGNRERFVRQRDLAKETPGFGGTEAATLTAEMYVRGDLAVARARHAEGAYGDAESLLLQLAGYLL